MDDAAKKTPEQREANRRKTYVKVRINELKKEMAALKEELATFKGGESEE